MSLGTIQAHMRFGAMETLDEQDARVRAVAARLVGRREDQVVSQAATTPGLLHTAFGLTGGVLVVCRRVPVAAARTGQRRLGHRRTRCSRSSSSRVPVG